VSQGSPPRSDEVRPELPGRAGQRISADEERSKAAVLMASSEGGSVALDERTVALAATVVNVDEGRQVTGDWAACYEGPWGREFGGAQCVGCPSAHAHAQMVSPLYLGPTPSARGPLLQMLNRV
jgi:hypothetical protein